MADPKGKPAPSRSPRKGFNNPAERKPRSRALRRQATDAERLLWDHLRGRRLKGRKFRRQVAIGPFIVDFVSVQDKLIVEADGGQHSEQESYDARRTAYLEQEGFRVLRFWNNDILKDIDSVLEEVCRALVDVDSTRDC